LKTAAVIVDMQEDFFSHARLSERRNLLARRVNELVQICRDAAVPLIWVRQEWADDLSDATIDARKAGIRIVVAGTPGASLLRELDWQPTDHVVVKKRYSAFFRTNLEAMLKASNTRRLIIAGVNTHACVQMTAMDAYQRDLEVVLARDCIDSYDAQYHEVSSRYMLTQLGTGMSNEEIRSSLSAVSARA
jgi:nicotinamidase-related amidase